MKKVKSNSHSRNNIVNLNDIISNSTKKNMGIVSYRISSKHNLRQQINGDIIRDLIYIRVMLNHLLK